MAFRKATMKKQVAEALAEQVPGDRQLVSVMSVAGPTPWLSVGFLGLIGQFLIKYYFITVTDQALLLHRMHRITQRPKEIVHAIPRDQARALFGEIQLNPLWSVFHIALPGETKPVRVNVHRMWRNELEELLAIVGGGPQHTPHQQQMPPQGYAPQQPGYAQQPQQGYAPQPQQGYAPQPGYAQPVPPQQGYAPPQQGYAQQPPPPAQGYAPHPGHQQQPPQPPQGTPQPPQGAPRQPGPYHGNPGQQQGNPYA